MDLKIVILKIKMIKSELLLTKMVCFLYTLHKSVYRDINMDHLIFVIKINYRN